MTSSFQDCIEQYQNLLDKEWITIYEESKDEINDYYAISDIISGMSAAEIKDYLSDYEWGFNPDCFGKTVFYRYGDGIEVQFENAEYGDAFVQKLADFFATNYPELKGFNRRGLYRMKQFYELYKDNVKVSTLLTQLSWSKHLKIMSACDINKVEMSVLCLSFA